MSNKIIPTHYKTVNDIDRNASVIKNPYAENIEVKQRNIKTVDSSQKIQPDVAAAYGGESRFVLNQHSGLMRGDCLNLIVSIGATTASAGTGSYVDGFILHAIKRIRMFSGSQEIFNLTPQSIFMYYQRFLKEKKDFYLAQARIGATGASAAINTTQSGVIFIPNPFIDYNVLKLDLMPAGSCYITVEWNTLSSIAQSTLAATFTGSISAYMTTTYLEVSPEAKREILSKQLTQNEYIENLNVALAAGTTTVSLDVPFFESEYLHFYISDNTTGAPYTALSNITDYYVSIDNSRYPDAIFSLADEQAKNVMYFQRVFSSNHHTIRFSSIPSRDDMYEDYHVLNGSMVWKQAGICKLTVNMTSLTNNSTLHLMSYGRASYRYANNRLEIEKKA